MHALLLASLATLSPGAEIKEQWNLPNTGWTVKQTFVLRNKDSWAKAWRTAHAKVRSEPALPDVDFTQYMVVGDAWGTQPTGGYRVEVTAVRQSEKLGTLVTVKRSKPRDDLVTAAETSPAAFAVVPKSDKRVIFLHR